MATSTSGSNHQALFDPLPYFTNILDASAKDGIGGRCFGKRHGLCLATSAQFATLIQSECGVTRQINMNVTVPV